MSLTCKDVMIPSDIQKTVHPDETVATAFKLIRQSRARFLPVVEDNGNYCGVFTSPTMLKLLLPRAVTIDLFDDTARMNLENLGFMNLSKQDFEIQIKRLSDEKVRDNMSLAQNIPVAAPDTPIIEGMFQMYKFKRHLILVEPDTNKFVGTVSPNSLLDTITK